MRPYRPYARNPDQIKVQKSISFTRGTLNRMNARPDINWSDIIERAVIDHLEERPTYSQDRDWLIVT